MDSQALKDLQAPLKQQYRDRVALMERMNSMMRRSVAFSPRVVLVTIGKKEMIEQIMIFGAIPKPNQMVSSGMMAMIGIAFDTMT